MSEGTPEKKPMPGMAIAALNIAILAVYTVVSSISGGGIIFDAFFIFIHVLSCIIIAIATKKWIWLLSAVLVLIIGFSTCAYSLKLD
jgi:hypothetical protein